MAVTGHTGFKGSWLALWLTTLGAQVFGLALPPQTKPNLFEALGLAEQIVHCEGDIRNMATVQAFMAEAQPHIVFHLAAQPIVRLSYTDPVSTFATNVQGTVHILEAFRHCPSAQVFVNVTSDKCYENREWLWGYRESDPLGGHDPYSASKGCAELVSQAYQRSFFRSGDPSKRKLLATVRAGNVIGGGDWSPDRIVPDTVRSLVRGEPIQVRNPRAIRPWQHVLEPLAGYLWLGARLWTEGDTFTGPWNFGPQADAAVPVGTLVETMITHWGTGSWIDIAAPKAPHEAQWLRLSCEKAQSRLGWQAVYSFEQTVQATLDWYRHFYRQRASDYACEATMTEYTLQQIKDYVAAARHARQPWVQRARIFEEKI
ncbi:CDP-glucose 4,6-dehydratase [Heliophilum fasciatum]|uniref:CDP-glucose 4,6-dehydratase n=1 Tax=Heliophilum fasciatum TaxID=35700 RepID=A0A4R2R993_9FIRM|nr:CDP-glucose 4,6-dehydratase [Heliophilum fasciatum]TCP59790.1 CDP-glucose 4,6-dehydratase [Heliophilum fasciatum]